MSDQEPAKEVKTEVVNDSPATSSEKPKISAEEMEGIFGKIRSFFMMYSDYQKGLYKGVTAWFFLYCIASVAYILSPFDIISEVPFLFLGLIDDAGIMAFFLYMVNKQLDHYKAWLHSFTGNDDSSDSTDIVKK